MPNWFFVIISCFLLSFPVSGDELSQPEVIPIVATADADDAMDHLFQLDPLIYIIVSGLLVAVGALTFSLKVLWDKNNKLTAEKDDLQESRVKISMATTEAISEAITLVKYINEGVEKLNDSEASRRLVDVEIKNHLINISKDLDALKAELSKLK